MTSRTGRAVLVGLLAVPTALAVLTAPVAGAADGDGLVTTPSTRTVKWTDADQPKRNPDDLAGGPDGRVYDSLKNFELRLSQTADLQSQTIQVSWTGATTAIANTGPVQLMQCWSDGPTVAPTREQCAFGGTDNPQPAYSRTPGADPRETTYQSIQSLEFATLDGAEFPSVSGLARSSWPSSAKLRIATSGGSLGACPAEAQGYRLIMNTPRGSPGAQVPPVISVIAPTAGLPPPLEVPAAAGFTRTYTHAPEPFTLADVGASVGVDRVEDDWPQGVYGLQLDCLDTVGDQARSLKRFVQTIVRDSVTADGSTTDVWRTPLSSELPRVTVRFDPVGDSAADAPTSDLDPSAILAYVQPRTTNELVEARSRPNGAGVVTMELLIDLDAQHLGCGRVEATRVRSCWLVAVPRFAPEPVVGSAPEAFAVNASPGPFAQTLWDRRVQVPLEFSPVATGCQIGSGLKQILTNDVTRAALRSWQTRFCDAPATASSVSQPLQDFQIRDSYGRPNRMGVVGLPPEGDKTTVVAPLSTSGVVVSFVVDRQYSLVDPNYAERNLTRATELNLNARLLAKLLTQSYDAAAAPNGGKGGAGEASNGDTSFDGTVPFRFAPARSFPKDNPRNLYEDKEFLDLNPDFAAWAPALGVSAYDTMAQLVVAANDTDAYQVVWQWILGDADAKAFVDGDPDPSGMLVNPYYKGQLTAATSAFRVLDPTCADRLLDSYYDELPLICTFNYASRAESDTAAAVAAVRGDTLQRIVAPAFGGTLDAASRVYSAPARQGGGGRPAAILALTTAPVAERYGLPVARLRNADGAFVAPSEAAMSAARDAMPSRADGVLVPDPAAVRGTGYPLTTMSYAVVDVSQTTQEQNNAFASILDYGGGAGQVLGRAPGQLPPGYAPLTSALTAQVRAASSLLRDPSSLLALPTTAAATTTATRPPGTTAAASTAAPTTRAAATTRASAAPVATVAPSSAATPPPAPPSQEAAPPGISVEAAAAKVSTGDTGSPLQWIIPVVTLCGLAAAGGGAALTVAGKRGGA